MKDSPRLFLSTAAPTFSFERQPDIAARLSVEFTVAFGSELTARLDINHRIRSTRLEPEQLATLRALPYAPFVDQNALQMFQ